MNLPFYQLMDFTESCDSKIILLLSYSKTSKQTKTLLEGNSDFVASTFFYFGHYHIAIITVPVEAVGAQCELHQRDVGQVHALHVPAGLIDGSLSTSGTFFRMEPWTRSAFSVVVEWQQLQLEANGKKRWSQLWHSQDESQKTKVRA
ncbi:hypothetical protein HJG60_010291 [Phyllostomus discolor]|uniref:Uncharacterized protein n=1 Tax=Phyllostomus discolor TaxID=89673 RepID=A0A834AWP7_9CHIR|nr:hypothetical protein HJG60_010291 [Phyllostomus discolor]